MSSAVINTTGRTLYNGTTSYAPNVSRVSSSNGVSRSYSNVSPSSNSASVVLGSQPGLGSAIGNKAAEANGYIRDYNNRLAQYLSDIAYYRNVSSAREAMSFNEYLQDKGNSFNRESMKLQQDYATYMSNTAHQREVKDLIAAGLNPVLSVHASGASTPSVTAASAAAASGGVSANSPMATLDTNIYAANSLFDVVSDIVANWLMNKDGKNIINNLAGDIKKGANVILDRVKEAKTAEKNAKNWSKDYALGNYEVYDPNSNTFSKGKPKNINWKDLINWKSLPNY